MSFPVTHKRRAGNDDHEKNTTECLRTKRGTNKCSQCTIERSALYIVQKHDVVRTWNLLGPTLDICVLIFPIHGWISVSFIQQFGNEKRLEKVTALAIGIVTTHFLVPVREHDEEIVNHFVIQPLQ
jgi:hypothetical protein